MRNKRFMLGNHILAASAVNLGFQCAASYPGTPSAEILQGIKKIGIQHAEWSVNEKVALEVAAGSAVSGIRSICSMKSVGLNVASDALMTLAYVDMEAALVIVVADTPGCLSSQNEQDTRWYGIAAKVPVIEPISPKDCEDTMKKAVEVSEKLKIPVIVRLTTRIAHGRQSVDIEVNKPTEKKPKFVKDVKRFVMLPVHGLSAHAKLFDKYDKARELLKPEVSGDGSVCVIASGLAYANASDVVKDEKIKCKLIRIPGIPFDEDEVRKQIQGCEKVVVLEEGHRVLEDIVRRIHPDVVSKKNSHGELGNHGVRETFSEVFGIEAEMKKPMKLPARIPRLCAGCPHLMSFYWLKDYDIPFPGDIGCYSLGYQYGVLDSLVCMGASIGMGQSIPGKKVAIIGDSTFYHAGIPALINAVEQNRDLCIMILDNDSTAMTGHQPVPKLDMKELCEACGAKTYVVDPLSKKMKKVLDEVLNSKGVHVIISKRTCARLTEKKPGFTITEKCTDCGECDKICCPAIVMENGKHKINDLCWGCGFCASICPEYAVRREKKSG